MKKDISGAKSRDDTIENKDNADLDGTIHTYVHINRRLMASEQDLNKLKELSKNVRYR